MILNAGRRAFKHRHPVKTPIPMIRCIGAIRVPWTMRAWRGWWRWLRIGG